MFDQIKDQMSEAHSLCVCPVVVTRAFRTIPSENKPLPQLRSQVLFFTRLRKILKETAQHQSRYSFLTRLPQGGYTPQLDLNQVLVKSDGNPLHKLSPKCKTRRSQVYDELLTIGFPR